MHTQQNWSKNNDENKLCNNEFNEVNSKRRDDNKSHSESDCNEVHRTKCCDDYIQFDSYFSEISSFYQNNCREVIQIVELKSSMASAGNSSSHGSFIGTILGPIALSDADEAQVFQTLIHFKIQDGSNSQWLYYHSPVH